jgi:hypothetical protein
VSKVILYEHPSENQAPFRLHRLVEWAGYEWDEFEFIRAPSLTPSPSQVVLAMGQESQEKVGVNGSILSTRGYPYVGSSHTVIPTISPAFIQAGNARYSAAFINDLQKAVAYANKRNPPQFCDYLLDPSPLRAYDYAKAYRVALKADPNLKLAFDIETPGKGDDEEDAELGDAPDRTWHIERIGFSYRGLSGISFEWRPEYMAAVRLFLESDGPKIVWNAGFDVPRLKRAGIKIGGIIHDGMVAWHILHSDLPKSLKFVATFTCPWQTAWKHLSGSRPAFYNCTDADVEYRAMGAIEQALREADLWKVYERDVIELQPVLDFMSAKGMPVDADVRLDRAGKLAKLLTQLKLEMEASVPMEARRIAHVYTNRPKDTGGLLSRPGSRQTTRCPLCGVQKPRKDHFKSFVKKRNPCAGATPEDCIIGVEEFYRLSEFTPSRDQFIRYHQHLKRPLPKIWDPSKQAMKVSFNEASLRKLMLKYPDDKLYSAVLQYRQADKLAGTYVGRIEE